MLCTGSAIWVKESTEIENKKLKAVLVGDIGGTKTSLALFSSESQLRKPLLEKRFASPEYDTLEAIVNEFLSGSDWTVDHASFGVAGPVFKGHSSLTNLSWKIDEKQIERKTGIKSALVVNDLVAAASFIPFMKSGDFITLNKGKPILHGTIGVIAPGTGLGEAFLTWSGEKYIAYPSEGGHSDFAPTNPSQIELLRYLQTNNMDHVSYERVCSGPGLKVIHEFYEEFLGIREQHPEVFRALAKAEDPAPVIVRAALGKVHCELCTKTLDTFLSILAAEASNLALKVFATCGIYITGGVSPHLRSALEDEKFLEAFIHKGRLEKVLEEIPVHLVLNPKIALLGAAHLGFEKMKLSRKRIRAKEKKG